MLLPIMCACGCENLRIHVGPYFLGLGFVVSLAIVRIGLSEKFPLHSKHWSLATGHTAVSVCVCHEHLVPFLVLVCFTQCHDS